MNQKLRIALWVLVAVVLITAGFLFFRHLDIAVLDPKGLVAVKQRNLMITVTLLTLIVVIPVFILLVYIVWTYREGNTQARYEPEWTNRKLEFVWWGIPFAIILVLSGIMWQSSHDLDPYRPLASSVPPLTIQVVALQWKWLFIYPQQNIATVNYIEFPAGTPLNFEITGDAPMNSFWIPQLGGQIYSMAGMSTSLHLIADTTGTFRGSSANLSGVGFSSMKFAAQAVTQSEFDNWVTQVKRSPQTLGRSEYLSLSKPSSNVARSDYSTTEPDLYDKIIASYMAPISLAGETK